MRAMLISINPPYTKMIFAGEKDLEWRHRSLPTGKYYCYETKHGGGCGAVIGEFIIWRTKQYGRGQTVPPQYIERGRVSVEFLKRYTERNPRLSANFITDPVLYDAPKDLSGFCKPCPHEHNCFSCDYFFPGIQDYDRCEPPSCGWWESDESAISRPPQSWCYVEELKL